MQNVIFFTKINSIIKKTTVVIVFFLSYKAVRLSLLKNTAVEYPQEDIELNTAFNTLTQINDKEDNVYITSDKVVHKDDIIIMKNNVILSKTATGNVKTIINDKNTKELLLKDRPSIVFNRKILE